MNKSLSKLELRVLSSEIRTDSNNDLFAEGLVNQTENWSVDLGGFKEKISKNAFRNAIDKAKISGERIDFLVEHDKKKLLATTENNSLYLWEDSEGLKFRANICPTSYGKDIYELLKGGLVKHMSFGFSIVEDEWQVGNDDLYLRTVKELELVEISAVRNPAYLQSAVQARGIELVQVEIPKINKEETMEQEIKEVEETTEITDEKVEVVESIEKVDELRGVSVYSYGIYDNDDCIEKVLTIAMDIKTLLNSNKVEILTPHKETFLATLELCLDIAKDKTMSDVAIEEVAERNTETNTTKKVEVVEEVKEVEEIRLSQEVDKIQEFRKLIKEKK